MLSAWLGESPTWILLLLAVGAIAGLGFSSDRLVDAVVSLARRLGVSPLIIGATLVSLGTTAPEVTVSVVAATTGEGSLALGNGIGSIIVDTGLIMGMVLFLGRDTLRGADLAHANRWRELATLLLAILLWVAYYFWPKGGVFPRLFGGILVVGLVGYLVSSVSHASRGESTAPENSGRAASVVVTMVWSLLLLLLTSRVLVGSAVILAQRWRVPQSVIAVSLVAFGTSVPEVSTALAALRKGHAELALGNVFGADVLNALLVIGVSA